MAVQAQYRSNVLLLNGSELEAKEMEPVFLDQSLVFFANGANGNPRKRVREVTSVPIASMPQQSQPVNLFSLQPLPVSAPLTPPTFVSLAELRTLPRPLVSTGLRLAFGDPNQHQSQNQSNPLLCSSSPASSSLFSSVFFEDLAAQINQQKDEIQQFLHAQGEQLQRTLAEKRQKHYRALLGAAEKSAARRLREKDAEVERAALRSSELEDRLARLRTESMAWQAKAMADQATAASLHAQLQHAAATAATDPAACGDPPPADDAESAYVDPGRAEPDHVCRTCRRRPASAVLLPCRHLCLCDACDGTAESCPVCRSIRTGSIHVFLS
ncbi:hypothetical protein OPV22_027150 [Ensete ventricosum]|uniref:RING-type domain-containing protein n=1 Tax=Ensete ventricosum TaxID=4639 RepID=A0AAV8Q4I8_ENSVE|nr:hypothetical protein OPV22_027150 [Ensete ventricosum]